MKKNRFIEKSKSSIGIQGTFIFLICTLIALFFWGQQYYWSLVTEREFKVLTSLSYELFYTYAWGILFYPIFILANKFRLEKKTLLKYVPIHILSAVIIAVIQKSLSSIPYFLIFHPEIIKEAEGTKVFFKTFGGSFDSFMVYWFVLGAYYGIDYYKQLSRSRLKESELEKQLAQANLQALKMQLHPHFLFNTLHAVSTLMQEDIKVARKMLAKLSDLLRVTLDNIGVQEVRLSQEIDFLKSYLEIEKMRFQERMKIEYNIAADTLSATVPNLILQPLVENAIKHGINDKKEGGKITIASLLDDDKVILKVSDDGQKCSNNVKEGIGLSNTKQRLIQLYGGQASFDICSEPEKGFMVKISIPYKKFVQTEKPEIDE